MNRTQEFADRHKLTSDEVLLYARILDERERFVVKERLNGKPQNSIKVDDLTRQGISHIEIKAVDRMEKHIKTIKRKIIIDAALKQLEE